MLVEKIIEATVNVRDPVNFCADKDRHLAAELRHTYVGRCFKGAFIVRLKAILKASDCRLSTTNASGEGYVDVQFLAEVAVFSRWDILVGVEVVSNQHLVVGTYGARPAPGQASGAKPAQAVVTLLASKAVEALAVGQKIAVRVAMAQHQPLQAHVAVAGVLLACDQAAPVYRLREPLDGSAAGELAPLLAAIDVELAARAALIETRRADLWFFELLLYAFRAAPTAGAAPADQRIPAGADAIWDGPGGLRPLETGAAPQNVLQLARRAIAGEAVPVAGFWSRSLALYRSSPLAAQAETPPAEWAAAVEGATRAVFLEYLKNILDFLVATREMAELYNTRELIDNHRGLWTVMRSMQKPA